MTTYVGPKNATTDERSGIRTYEWDGVRYPSVTSLRRLLGVPFPLATWMVEQAIRAAISNTSVLDSMLAQEGEVATAKWLRVEANSKRDKAANRGTSVHDAASKGLLPQDVEEEVALPLTQYYDFLDQTKAEVLLSERQVWNLEMGYAGSLDALYRLKWDKQVRKLVTDIKTGSGLYVDHALQLMGYALGDFIGEDNIRDEAATQLLLNADGLAILHLGDDTWELVEIDPTPLLYQVFEAMVQFAHWQIDTPSIDNLVVRRMSK
jgi:hypothetical protein